jgi:hypothetical protein
MTARRVVRASEAHASGSSRAVGRAAAIVAASGSTGGVGRDARLGRMMRRGGAKGRRSRLTQRLAQLLDDMREDRVRINPHTVRRRLQDLAADPVILEVDNRHRVHWRSATGQEKTTSLKQVMNQVARLHAGS